MIASIVKSAIGLRIVGVPHAELVDGVDVETRGQMIEDRCPSVPADAVDGHCPPCTSTSGSPRAAVEIARPDAIDVDELRLTHQPGVAGARGIGRGSDGQGTQQRCCGTCGRKLKERPARRVHLRLPKEGCRSRQPSCGIKFPPPVSAHVPRLCSEWYQRRSDRSALGTIAMSKSIALRVLAFLFVAVLVALPITARAQDGPLHINREARFAVIFPGEPMTREIAYTTRSGTTVPARELLRRAGRWTLCRDGGAVSRRTIGGSARGRARRGRAASKGRGPVSGLCRLRSGDSGRQLNIFETNGRQLRASVYMYDRRLYITEASAVPASPGAAIRTIDHAARRRGQRRRSRGG